MDTKILHERGISIIELILSVSIIGMFSTMAIVNFRSNKQDDILRIAGFRVADAVRAAQSYALAGVPQNADLAIASAQEFGVTIARSVGSNSGEAIIFADVSGGTAGVYDVLTDKKIKEISLDPDNRKTVELNDIKVGGISGVSPVHVAFKKPDATGFIDGKNGDTDPKEIVLTFKHTQSGHTKTVTINRVTGRVDAQY